ncbi:hypothetical protein LWF01_17510 [Saxibacter everestensis]|uniref:Uncharacterized protein n=1 Tax=Saxibacter everestensis TaxID=2909229 RepID=A0ABY8QSE1_9MICO|nr:hypothetical protein LWF01_17510 [Brevibacteriaceae bacterium ZFBP1038]
MADDETTSQEEQVVELGPAIAQLSDQSTDEDELSTKEQELLTTDQTKKVTVDPESGVVESVVAIAGPAALTPTRSNCSNNRPCWIGNVPSFNFGFAGTGTAKGTWPSRGAFNSRNRDARICWTTKISGPTICTSRMGHNTEYNFNGARNVTGKSVRLY